MKIPSFKVLTRESVINLTEAEDREMLYEEQDSLFKAMFDNRNESVIYHTFDSPFATDEEDNGNVSDYDFEIQSLALKDGVDLVRFENGNIGFVSYCNKCIDAFEIIRKETL